ncbi:MAG: hypothetical protein ABI467_26100 [Kofleriaceae bacterium]
MTTKLLILSSCLLFAAACGPSGRPDNFGDDGNGHTDSGSTGPEICTDNVDNDGDGLVDCHDPDCSGIDGCPVCGQVENPEGTGIFLPDGISSGGTCSTNADCPPATPNCIAFVDTANNNNTPTKECHASYTSTLNFVGFPQGAKLDDTSKLLKVCASMEHSFLHDLNVELISPSGQSIGLQKFLGRVGPKIYLGIPVDNDDSSPKTGVGYEYCWTAGTTATTTMLASNWNTATANPTVVAGDYHPDVPFTALQGADLNGMWTFRVTDMYHQDNGHLFSWQINFDPSLVVDCSGPIIE